MSFDPKRQISIVWGVDDVLDRATERGINIIEQQALEILFAMKSQHDASIGINWDVIDTHLDMLGT